MTPKFRKHAEDKIKEMTDAREKLREVYYLGVQQIANQYKVHIATGHMSDTWQIRPYRGRSGFYTESRWQAEKDEDGHPAFDDLNELDEMFEDWVSCGNMEMFHPQPV